MTSQVQQSENRHDEAGGGKETRTAGFGQTILEPFLVFLRLGLTSFGGPIALLGYFRQEFVGRRKWLSEQTFADLVALCNFLPGPTSSQVCYSIGMTRGGIPGAISAWSAFTLPSAIIMLLAAYGIHWMSGGQGTSWVHCLKVVAVAVVAQAAAALRVDFPAAQIILLGPVSVGLTFADIRMVFGNNGRRERRRERLKFGQSSLRENWRDGRVVYCTGLENQNFA